MGSECLPSLDTFNEIHTLCQYEENSHDNPNEFFEDEENELSELVGVRLMET